MIHINSNFKKMQKAILLSLFLLSTLLLSAQRELKFGVTAKTMVDKNNTIHIRWAPTNFETFDSTLKKGYKIVRQYVGSDTGKFKYPKEVKVFEQPFVPISKENWTFATRLDTIAYAVLYDSEFSSSTSTGATLSDELVKAYQSNNEKQNRYFYVLFAAEQSLAVADKLGLYLKDSPTDPNGIYIYSVFPKGIKSNDISPAIVNVTLGKKTIDLPQLPTPNVIASDKSALLNFNIEGFEAVFSYYNIYRDNGANGSFMKINPNPVLFMNEVQSGGRYVFYADALPNNSQTFKYYVVGVDAFEQQSPPSPIVSVKGLPGALRASVNIASITEDKGKINITWTFPDSLNSKIKGFKITRSEDALGVFKPIQSSFLSSKIRVFSEIPPKGAAYYRVTAYDLYDRIINSIDVLGQVKDISPPAKPVISTCICDEKGVGRITWKPNTESDLKGYRVYMSSIKDAENYAQLTSDVVTDNTFEYDINLKILNKEIYFNITAEDLHANQSVFSAPCTMKRPDVIPPVAPVITKADITSKGIDMAWIPSSSDDVVSQQVERKQLSSTGIWEVVVSKPSKSKQSQNYTFIDTTANNAYSYLYRITVKDASDLVAYSETMKVQPHIIYNRAPIMDIKAYCDCTYIDNGTRKKKQTKTTLSPIVNGNHPIVESFHVKNPSFIAENQYKNTDLSVIFEWKYEDKNQDLQDFVIYRQLPNQTMSEYGFSKPNQMDVIYDPIVYSYAQSPSVLLTHSQWLMKGSKSILPIMNPNGKQSERQYMDHKVPMQAVKKQHANEKAALVKYFISARFTDGTESPLSSAIDVYFN